ncbi:F-box domain-containing protein [Mycena kentingensis (nom. inval.)]|nr:F-box domain-containing protein [Mycena kentingensis (nom. inval.)]
MNNGHLQVRMPSKAATRLGSRHHLRENMAQLSQLLDELRSAQSTFAAAIDQVEKVSTENGVLKDVARIREKEHADEVRRLKLEISHLKDTVRQQVETTKIAKRNIDSVARLRREKEQLEEKVELYSRRLLNYRPRVSAAELPHEILLLILRNCLAPEWLLRGIREPSPSSLYQQDMAMKSALSLVCKGWSPVAEELLYGHVHLRSIGQVVAFARSLEARPALGGLVLRLDLGCFVPRGYRTIFQAESTRILDLCPRLAHFGFVPVFLLDHNNPELPHPLLPPLGSSITSLEISGAADSTGETGPLMLLRLQLLILRLPLSSTIWPNVSMEFPVLEELFFRVHTIPPTPADGELKWTTPALRTLAIISDDALPSRRTWQRWTPTILKAVGKGITTLSLTYSAADFTLGDITQSCPRLQHLVITATARGRQLAPPPLLVSKHPTVRFLDIWCHPLFAPPTLNVPDVEQVKADFPSLEIYRFLDGSFLYLDALPLACPPGLPVMRAEVEVRRDGADSSYETAAIGSADRPRPAWMGILEDFIPATSINSLQNLNELVLVDDSDDEWLPSPRDGPDSDGSSSYESDSEEEEEEEEALPTEDSDHGSDSDSMSETEREGGLDGPRQFYMEEDWEATREETLDIFSRIVATD